MTAYSDETPFLAQPNRLSNHYSLPSEIKAKYSLLTESPPYLHLKRLHWLEYSCGTCFAAANYAHHRQLAPNKPAVIPQDRRLFGEKKKERRRLVFIQCVARTSKESPHKATAIRHVPDVLQCSNFQSYQQRKQ
jgi:hypothetical protein